MLTKKNNKAKQNKTTTQQKLNNDNTHENTNKLAKQMKNIEKMRNDLKLDKKCERFCLIVKTLNSFHNFKKTNITISRHAISKKNRTF